MARTEATARARATQWKREVEGVDIGPRAGREIGRVHAVLEVEAVGGTYVAVRDFPRVQRNVQVERRIWPPARDRIGEWLCQGNLDDALWREIRHRRWLVIGFSLLTLLGLYFVFGRVVGSYRS